MSGILNKVKEAVTGHHADTTHDTTTHNTSTTGTHGSSALGGSNYDNTNTHGTGLGSSTHSTSSGNTVPGNVGHKKNILAPSTTGTENYTHPHGAPGTYGATGDYSNTLKSDNAHNPDRDQTSELHNSNLGNKVDPRVDSNTLDRTGGSGTAYGSTATGGTHHNHQNAGPHSSNIGNAIDPRVDSDRDGSRTAGYGQTGTGVGSTGYGSSTTTGTHGHTSTGGMGQSSTAGPHNSNMANKLDPRVDSDRSNDYSSSNTGYDQRQSGVTPLLSDRVASKVESHHQPGYVATGSHSDNIGMSDRFDHYTSGGTGTTGGLTGSTGGYGSNTGSSGYDNNNSSYGSGTTGTGSGGGVVSSLLNKLDPRTDSTNTNTTGSGYNSGSTGNYGSGTGVSSSEGTSNHPYSNRDTNDASQVPPSAFGREAGHHMSTGGSKSGGAF